MKKLAIHGSSIDFGTLQNEGTIKIDGTFRPVSGTFITHGWLGISGTFGGIL